MAEAQDGDRLVIVSCCKLGPVLVREVSRGRWQCRCGGRGKDLGVIVLQLDALPADRWG